MGILSFARGVINKMLGKNELESRTGIKIAATTEMYNAIRQWKSIFINKPEWGSKYQPLGIPGQLCEKLIKTAMSEFTPKLNNTIYEPLFLETIERFRLELPKAIALGGMVIKPYQATNGIGINFIHADSFFPTKISSDGKITGAMFVSKSKIGKQFFTDIEIQDLTDTTLIITNKKYVSLRDDDLGSEIPVDDDVMPEVIIQNVKAPLFAYFKVPKNNKIDDSSPLGESVFSDAVHLFFDADKNYYDTDFEFRSKKSYTFISRDLILKDDIQRDMLPDNDVFVKIGDEEDINKKLQRTTDQTIRVDSFRSRANDIKRSIEFACGVGYGLISDPETIQRTATEIHMGENQNRINNADIQNAIQKSIERLLVAMSDLIYLTNGGQYVKLEATYSWGDSVLTGTEEQRNSMRQDVQSGILPGWIYLVKNYNFSESQAKQLSAEAREAQTFTGMDLGV